MSVGSMGASGLAETLPPPIPYSMRLFERMQISAMVVGWAYATFTYRMVLHGKVPAIVFISMLMVATTIVAVLVFQISRRRSEACKWLLIVLSALATAPWFALVRRTGVVDFAGALALLQGALQIASLGLLVRPSAREWFASGAD